MGEKKLLIAVDEFKMLRLKCNHCQTAVVFALDTGDTIGPASCSSCGTPMADAHHIVNGYRRFFVDLQRFAKNRGATFEVAWRDD
jgi:transcription elongation factor Elf1